MKNPDRRDFGRITLGSALGAAAFLAAGKGAAAVHNAQPGIKLCAQSSAKPTDDDLLFLQQIGAEYVSVGSTPDLRTAEGFLQIKKRYADAGITVWNIGNTSVHNMPEVTLNLPGRDKKIEEYKQYLRNLGQAGHLLHHLRPHGQRHLEQRPRHHPRRIGPPIRHGEPGQARRLGRRRFQGPLSHGREFTKEEIWENYTYFIKQVAPVAEEAGVRIGIHPDDPPVPVLAGVPRCIFGNFDGYRRAMEIANSPNVGICLCCGTWLEGGTPAHRQRSRGDDPLLRREEDLEDPFPQRERAAAALCRDLHGQRLLRHVQDHEGAARRQLRRHRDSGPFARAWWAGAMRKRHTASPT